MDTFPTDAFWIGLFNYIIQKGILTTEPHYELFYYPRRGIYIKDEVTLYRNGVIRHIWVLKRQLLEGFSGGSNVSWVEFERQQDAETLLEKVRKFWKNIVLGPDPVAAFVYSEYNTRHEID